jgi:hypothetical protein
MMDWMIERVLIVQNRLRIYEDCRKIAVNLPKCFVNEPVISSSLEHDKQKGRFGQY